MSLLAPGKCLLSKSRVSTVSKTSLLDSADEAAASSRIIELIRKPGGVLGTAISEEPGAVKISAKKRPSLIRQSKITNSTGQIYKLDSSSPSRKSSVLKKLKSATSATPAQKHKSCYQPQVSFAPSPEKRGTLKKSSSQTDVDLVDRDASLQLMKHARSSDSNLYRSAESEFRSTTSLSSSDFFSAESDLEEPDGGIKESVPKTTVDEDESNSEVPIRPGSLRLENENVTSDRLSGNNLLTPNVTRSLSMSPGSNCSNERSSSERRDSVTPPLFSDGHSLSKCYESYLTVLTLNSVTKVDGDSRDDNDGWFDEGFYRLPAFVVVKKGVCPNVMVDKEGKERKQAHKMDSTNRELTFDELDSSGKSTSIAVHLQVCGSSLLLRALLSCFATGK